MNSQQALGNDSSSGKDMIQTEQGPSETGKGSMPSA
jgi:hypothetical protein